MFDFHAVGERYTDDAGRVTHAELELDGALVYLGWPGEHYMSPAHHAEVCDHAKMWSAVPYIVNGVHITIEDVDAHATRARAAGRIDPSRADRRAVRSPVQRADIEGHRWMFMQATGA